METKALKKEKNKLLCIWHFVSKWFYAALAGVCTLGLVRILAPVLGFTVKINLATLTLATLLGTPGVILVLLLRFFFYCG